MKKYEWAHRFLFLILLCVAGMPMTIKAADSPYVILIHGGAGVDPKTLTPEMEAAKRKTLEEALRAGSKILKEGGSSVDAVQAAVVVFEDSANFNAGRGAALTEAGTVEMDAAIMDGNKHAAGTVGGVSGVCNPIRLARMVMDHSPAVMLAGTGAEAFARKSGLPFAPLEYFVTPAQQEKLKKAKSAGTMGLSAKNGDVDITLLMGTVGAVALDKAGHLAAATSTGGLTNKPVGRIGDTPLIGAGTYAKDGVCAVSCTGHGEFFIRAVAAYDVAARMMYKGEPVDKAAGEVIHGMPPDTGGLIAVDAKGNIATPFTTPGMFHGWIKDDGAPHIAIYEQ